MLRTSIYAAQAQGIPQVTMPLRTGLRAQSAFTHLKLTSASTRTVAQKPFRSSRFSSKPTASFTFTAHSIVRPSKTPSLLQQLRASIRHFHSSRSRLNGKPTSPNSTSNLGSSVKGSSPTLEAEPQSFSARIRKLFREYGWSALGVYLALTALDFPLCYMLVRYLGTEKIGEWEHIVISNIERVIPQSVKQTWHEWRVSMKKTENEITGDEQITGDVQMAGWGVEEADERYKKEASLATQLALAYAIHKSFIFIRVPITAAVTPKVVKILRGWGWDIGKRTTKEAKALKRAMNPVPKATGS